MEYEGAVSPLDKWEKCSSEFRAQFTMTSEARLDRLERIALLLAKAGFRARRDWRARDREHEEKINYLIDLQIKNEEKFARNEERFARTEERFVQLAESQASTDRKLNSLIDIVREARNGDAADNN